MDNALITNIQRFSLHDGPGIRTTIFFKGCSLRCPWCSNPENLNCVIEEYDNNGIKGFYGYEIDSKTLLKEVLKDRLFYEGDLENINYGVNDSVMLNKLPGGVTYSGGEALLQLPLIEYVLVELKRLGIHQAVETCLFVPKERLEFAQKYINLFYVDIKFVDEYRCNNILKGKLCVYLQNIKILLRSGKPIVFRIPVIGGYTDAGDNLNDIVAALSEWKADYENLLKVEIIKGHNLSEQKYKSLKMNIPEYVEVGDDILAGLRNRIEDIGIETEICRI